MTRLSRLALAVAGALFVSAAAAQPPDVKPPPTEDEQLTDQVRGSRWWAEPPTVRVLYPVLNEICRRPDGVLFVNRKGQFAWVDKASFDYTAMPARSPGTYAAIAAQLQARVPEVEKRLTAELLVLLIDPPPPDARFGRLGSLRLLADALQRPDVASLRDTNKRNLDALLRPRAGPKPP